MAKSTLDVLTEAYHLLDDKQRWTRRAFARNSEGAAVHPKYRAAESWCAMGAIDKVCGRARGAGRLYMDAVDTLSAQVAGEDVHVVNDGPDGYRRIRAGFRRAIRALGGKP